MSTNIFSIQCDALTLVSIVPKSFFGHGSFTPEVTEDPGSRTWTVTVSADRSSSSVNAEKYAQEAGGQYHMFVKPSFSGKNYSNLPETMNFLFAVTLTFGSSGDAGPFFLGQGLSGVNNYWWFGGQPVLNSSPYKSPIVYVVTPGGLYQAAFPFDSTYQMSLVPAS